MLSTIFLVVENAAADPGLQSLKSLSLEDLINKLAHSIVDFSFHLAIALLVFYLGKLVIRKLFAITARVLLNRRVDTSLSTFVLSLVRIVLYFILIVTVIGILGINTSSFIALFASAGVAIGMALSGTLQNFAGGVLILLLKPYRVGDYIETQGYAGTVTEIQIFHTIISTYDNKSIIIPNGGLSTGSINNWSREQYRRVQWDIAISYGDDVAVARKVIVDMLKTDTRVVQTTIEADVEARLQQQRAASSATGPDPLQPQEKKHGWLWRAFHRRKAQLRNRIEDEELLRQAQLQKMRTITGGAPTVIVSQLADSSVNLSARAWVRTEDYWSVFYDYNERIYNALPQHGITFPFPQMSVHLEKS